MSHDLGWFRGDVFGGVTSMVVSLPLALAYGIASGMGAAAGLYGAIAVGFLTSVFGGARCQISGPTAPMTVAMAVIVAKYADSLAEALAIVILAGLIQIVLGTLRVGRFVVYTPYAVVSGFTSGIGAIIVVIHILPFLGHPPATGGAIGVIDALPHALSNVNVSSLIVAAITLAVGLLWPKRLAKYLPSTLTALIAGTLVGVLWLNDAPVIGPVPTGLPALQLDLPSSGFIFRALEPAFILALIGSVDSLLTSLVADSLTGTRHNPNRELVAQGIGNIAAGLFGSLPGSVSTMGTLVNIRAGGTTRLSGVLCALLLLALVLGFGGLVETVPLAALAGVLMKVGWEIIDWRLLVSAHRFHRGHLLVMLTTMSLTVFVDLVTAVAIGLIAAGMIIARELEQLELDSVVSVPLLDQTFLYAGDGSDRSDPYAARVGMLALRGAFTVASAHKLVDAVGDDIKQHEVVILDFSQTTYIDDSAAMVIEQLLGVAEEKRTGVIVMGLAASVAKNLWAFNILRLVPDGCIVEDLDEAREAAKTILGHEEPG